MVVIVTEDKMFTASEVTYSTVLGSVLVVARRNLQGMTKHFFFKLTNALALIFDYAKPSLHLRSGASVSETESQQVSAFKSTEPASEIGPHISVLKSRNISDVYKMRTMYII